MGRLEVLKVVDAKLIDRPGVRDRFLREIQSAAKLQHKNIVTAYSAMRLGNGVVLAMEYVDGDDLAKLVKTVGPLPVPNACYFIYQAALGLQHAHERGMVHRDIKPANLILAREGKRAVVKVLDFGLAKVSSEGKVESGLTQEGQMLGTPDYISPEQTIDAQKADIRADIYSLGCTFYFLLTGGPPFTGTSLFDLLQAHHSTDAKPLNLVRPGVPLELAALVAKMLAKEPERRFQTPDGRTEGEAIRIRDQKYVIGRTEGDLRIPIDGRISSRHVEITLQTVGGLPRWVVTDLQSTHGMYVRVSRTALADKAEFLVGNGRYRFDIPLAGAFATTEVMPGEPSFGKTHGWDDGPGPFRPPALTELLGREVGNRTLLVKDEYWIGSDPSCYACRPDDPFCEPRHARLYRGGAKGGWHVEHNKTQNGLWLRMAQIAVEAMIQFQIGEQRFRLKVQ